MIDTASNYRSGRAELAIGYALNSLLMGISGIQRSMLFISTKAGFLQEDIKQEVGIDRTPGSMYSASSCMVLKQRPVGLVASCQWHAGVALAQCSSRQPVVHPGIRLQQAIQVGLL